MDIAIRTLAGVSHAEMLAAFNHGFSDYAIPMNLSDETFRFKLQSENISREHSAGAFADGKLIGLILHGIDEIEGQKRVFNAGTAVAPEFRGQKLTQRMYAHILPLLKEQGYSHHRLEVLASNLPAKKSYENAGFRDYRDIVSYKGAVDTPIPKHIDVKEIETPERDVAKNFWNAEPTWQNDTPSLLRAGERFKAVGAFVDGSLAGYAVYDPVTSRIKQFGVRKDARRKGVGTALFSYITAVTGQVLLTHHDTKDTGSVAFFEKLGLEPHFQCYEMTLDY